MRVLFLVCLLITSPIWGNSITSTIHSVDLDVEGNDHFIKLDSGEVVFVDDLNMIEDLTHANIDSKIEFNLDDNKQLVYWRSVPNDLDFSTNILDQTLPTTTSPNYTPSVITGLATLAGVFSNLRTDSKRRAECFHRAYIWAFEENKRSGRFLTKHFLFFTRKYIREARYKWWFHVAPSILFDDAIGNRQFMMLDKKFSKTALTVKEWTDLFISSKRSCPIVYTYSHYNNNQEAEHCYLMPTPMYYLQPLDIENFEKTGVEKKSFLQGDLNISYSRGFTGARL